MKVLITLVLVFLLAGCAAGKGDGAGSTTTGQEETTANGTEETTVYKEETTVLEAEDYPRPPVSTLSYGGREVKGTLGSYCWFSGNKGLCADAFRTVVPRKQWTLTVPSGSEMVFRFGGKSSAYTVEAVAYPLNKLIKGLQGSPADLKDLESSLRSLKAYGSGIERTIPAEVPPGEYVVAVGLAVPVESKGWTQNDAEYSFRIMVE